MVSVVKREDTTRQLPLCHILSGDRLKRIPQSCENMKYLFKDWKNIQERIKQARTLILFLDYDGTLTPIVSRPELALCPPDVKKLLERLRDLPGVYLTIISGRSLEDVREKVGVSGISYVGSHGLEIENPAGKHKDILSSSRKRELKRITRDLKNSFKEIPGILFEEKGPILSVHYRSVPKKIFVKIPQTIEREIERWGNYWKITHGKMVLEIRPDIDFHKGKAVREILKVFPSRGRLPIYLGDDQTDEDAFRVFKALGVSVFIGPERFSSDADYFLRDPGEVQEFLSRCEETRMEIR